MFERPVLKWLLIALAALGFYFSSEGSRDYWKRRRTLKRLEQKLTDLKISNDKLSKEITRLKTDPKALEQIARDNLGLLKPGEIEYRFVVDRSCEASKNR